MFKGEKGITLIALAITIIVLLILAGISITALTQKGVLNQAETARSQFSNASVEESKRLDSFSSSLDTIVKSVSIEAKKNAIQ